ncbi:MAG: chromate transporter [Eubacterium sp.]|nr:chromate transporter [Eubacterium sp.]
MKRIRDNIYIQLFYEFFMLGIVTFGGGMSMIPLLQGIVVDKRHWLTEDETIDCIAVSQGLPGVIAINMATYVGEKKKGFLGALVATIGMLIPSMVVIILVVEFLNGFSGNKYIEGALVGIKATTVGLITYALYKVGRQVIKGPFSAVLAIVSFVMVAVLGMNAMWAILLGVVSGLVYVYVVKPKGGEGE